MDHTTNRRYETGSPGHAAARKFSISRIPTPAVTLSYRAVISVVLLFLPVILLAQATGSPPPLSLLFLGDRGAHEPAERANAFIPAMASRGITITYTDNLADINAATLARYDGLIVYADQVNSAPDLEKTILEYVAGGNGFIPVHCAISFLNSPAYHALVGAKFRYHSTGRFVSQVNGTGHPVLTDFHTFETWDETYVHTTPGPECTVLLTRREEERDEPWTWVHPHGKGRVFYTAYGHDERTWESPEFVSLMASGIRWSCAHDLSTENPADSGRQ